MRCRCLRRTLHPGPSGKKGIPAISIRRAFIVGFVIGAVVLVLAAFAGVLVEMPDWLFGLLTIGSVLLRPFQDAMADWPGLLNIGLAAVANGLVYGLVAVVAALVINAIRR